MPQDSPRALSDRWSAAFNDGDAAALADLYEPEARLLTTTKAILTGRDQIRDYWRSVMEHGLGGHGFEPIAESDHDDVAWQAGGWRTVRDAGEESPGTEAETGNYVLILGRGDQGWAIRVHIWNV